MSHFKTFEQFVFENMNSLLKFTPQYFNEPYSIPEDRFENGLLKSNIYRKTKIGRSLQPSEAKYRSINEFFEKNPISKVEKDILAEVNKVIKFIKNNKLTGKEVDASFEQEVELSEYLKALQEYPNEDLLLGIIYTNLPFYSFAIRVDYDIYKNIPVFTFWYDGDLFYYYGIFTLEENDVSGSGEMHTYITSSEFIDYLFYETVWRAAFNELSQLNIEASSINISDSEFERITETSKDPNYSKPVVNDYFDKNFIKVLKNWIKTENPVLSNKKKAKFNYDTIPPFGKMSFPGDSSKILSMSMGPAGSEYTIRLLEIIKNSYLAIKISYNERGITKIESGEYSTLIPWDKVDWKPLTQSEVDSLYFIDSRGNIKWIKNLMS